MDWFEIGLLPFIDEQPLLLMMDQYLKTETGNFDGWLKMRMVTWTSYLGSVQASFSHSTYQGQQRLSIIKTSVVKHRLLYFD